MAGKFGYDGAPTVSSDGGMLAANNLSDLTDASAGRSNLGLGTAATHPSTDFDAAGAAATAQTAAQAYADTGDAARILKSARQLKTANYTAVIGDLVAADTTGGTFTVTIPAASGGKGRVLVKWVAGAVAPTIALSGSDHFNTTSGATSATPVLLNQGYQFESDGTSVWTVTADDLPLSQLDLRYAPIASPTFTGTTTAPEFTPSGLTGATAASRYVGATTGGPPTTGTFAVGDVVNDQAGAMWVCVSAGTPGHWVQSGRLEDFLRNGSQPYRETFDRRYVNTNSVTAGGNGVMALSAVILYPGDVVTNLSFMSGSTGLTMGSNNDGHLWAALYNPSRSLMSQSTDIGGGATWTLKTWKQFTLGAAQTITTLGIYYAAIMLHTGTGGSPVANTLYGITGGSGIIFGSGATGQPASQAMLGATGGSALGATAPAGPVSLTSSGQIVYAVTS